jgi:hypothetical protein
MDLGVRGANLVEFHMRSKWLLSTAATTLAALGFLATAAPASAQWYGRGGWGWGPGALAAGIVGGAVAAATSPLWAPGYYGYYGGYYPGYAYGYGHGTGYGYGYAPGYAYGPSASYGYGYSPGYWGDAYGSADRSTTVIRRHTRVRHAAQ